MVSGYRTSTSFPRVDGWSTDPLSFGASQLGIREYVYEHLRLSGHGSKTCNYGTVPWFMITWCLINLVLASQLGIRV